MFAAFINPCYAQFRFRFMHMWGCKWWHNSSNPDRNGSYRDATMPQCTHTLSLWHTGTDYQSLKRVYFKILCSPLSVPFSLSLFSYSPSSILCRSYFLPCLVFLAFPLSVFWKSSPPWPTTSSEYLSHAHWCIYAESTFSTAVQSSFLGLSLRWLTHSHGLTQKGKRIPSSPLICFNNILVRLKTSSCILKWTTSGSPAWNTCVCVGKQFYCAFK